MVVRKKEDEYSIQIRLVLASGAHGTSPPTLYFIRERTSISNVVINLSHTAVASLTAPIATFHSRTSVITLHTISQIDLTSFYYPPSSLAGCTAA
jgi:hypothetical protein